MISLDLSGESLHRRGYRLRRRPRAAQGKSGCCIVTARGLARYRRARWRAARPDVRVRHVADRRRIDGDGYRAECRARALGFSGIGCNMMPACGRMCAMTPLHAASAHSRANGRRFVVTMPAHRHSRRRRKYRARRSDRTGACDAQGSRAFVPPTHQEIIRRSCYHQPAVWRTARRSRKTSNIYMLQLGQRLREHFVGWEAAVFTGNPDLGKSMTLRSFKQYRLFNGAIPSQLLRFHVQAELFVDRNVRRC